PALIANGVLILLLFALEKGWGFRFEASQRLTYDNLDLIAPEKHSLLVADLQRRTGLPVTRVQLGRIDFLRDSAELTIYYDEHPSAHAHADTSRAAALRLAEPALHPR